MQISPSPPWTRCFLGAEVWAKVLGLVLTGMVGRPARSRATTAGGSILAQDEASSVAWGMPGQVAHAGVRSAVLPLSEIAPGYALVRGRSSMTPQDFDYLRKVLRQRSAGALGRETISRRKPSVAGCAQARARGPRRIGGELKAARPRHDRRSGRGDDHQQIILLRDKVPFEHFRQTIMPALMEARAREKRIRIWCPACATGQEPYSLA